MSWNSLASGRSPRHLISFLLPIFVSALVATPAWAAPARPDAFTDVQPDGQAVSLRLHGDEHFNWAADLDGYTVIRHKGWYEYARLNPQGKLVGSGLKVGQGDPKAWGLQKNLLPSPAQRAPGKNGGGSDSGAPQGVPPQGSVKNLVVLVQFSNHVGRALPTTGEIDVLMNAPGGDPVLAPTGSVRDVYLQNSYGQFELNSDVAAWVTVSNTEQYYANGNSGDSTLWQALREALDEVDRTVDFRDYDSNGDGRIDAITFLHSGFGAEWGGSDEDGTPYTDRIWSHRWVIQNPAWTSAEGVQVADYHISPALWGTSGDRIGRIGVIAHETGHFFGLPDLYDTDGGGAGIGSYGLMANSWDFNGSQLCPPHFSPWSKMQLGWISPVEIAGPGHYSLDRSADNDAFFVISEGFPANEYLLIENRQRAGFDCSLPQGGLAVWHIDDEAGFNTEGYPGGRWPSDGRHYRVALAQADGGFHLERGYNRGDSGDLHHGLAVDAMAPGPDGHPNTDAYQDGRVIASGHTLSDISVSGYTMTFCLNGCSGGGGAGAYDAPSGLAASVTTTGSRKNQVKTVSLSWTDNSNGDYDEDGFVIERCEETGKGKSKTCSFAEHAVVGANVNGYSETAGSGTFKYRVKARSGVHGDSAYSNEVKI